MNAAILPNTLPGSRTSDFQCASKGCKFGQQNLPILLESQKMPLAPTAASLRRRLHA
jgi:hypothetical protein